MTLLWADSFEHDANLATFVRRYEGFIDGGDQTFRRAGGNFGGVFMSGGFGTAPFEFVKSNLVTPGTEDTIGIGCALYVTKAKSEVNLFSIFSGATTLMQVRMVWDAAHSNYRLSFENATGVVQYLYTSALPVNTWNSIQIRIKFSASGTGTIKVLFNGLLEAEVSELTTGATVFWDAIHVRLRGESAGEYVGIDDYWVTDGDLLGTDITVEPIYPFGDGSPNDWISNIGGDHYIPVADSLINGLVDDDLSKLSQPGGGGPSEELFSLIPLSRIKSDILGVLFTFDAKSDGSDVIECRQREKGQLTSDAPANFTVDTPSYKRYSVMALNPNPSSNRTWTPERIDEGLWGFGVS